MEDLRVSANLRGTKSNETNGKEEESGKLEILKLGKLVYDFVQKLDPLIYLYHKITDLVTWKQPYKTIGVGIGLTLMIYNLKMAIFLAGLMLFFGRNYIFKRMFRLQRYSNINERLIIPQ